MLVVAFLSLLVGCTGQTPDPDVDAVDTSRQSSVKAEESMVEHCVEQYRGFELDDVLHSATEGDIHFSLKVPEGYEGSEPHALFVTLPGWEGLYFQGAGTNLEYEDFGVVASDYVPSVKATSAYTTLDARIPPTLPPGRVAWFD